MGTERSVGNTTHLWNKLIGAFPKFNGNPKNLHDSTNSEAESESSKPSIIILILYQPFLKKELFILCRKYCF